LLIVVCLFGFVDMTGDENMTKKKREELNWGHWIAGQSGVVSFAVADPGTAKTVSHEQHARDTEKEFIGIELSTQVPEDIGGYPKLSELKHGDHVHEVMRMVPMESLVKASLQPTVVLMDEFGSIAPGMQAAALGLICKGLGPQSTIYAAGNPGGSAANGCDLTPPMVNRMHIAEWQIDTDGHDEGMSNGLVFPPPSAPVVPRNFMDYFPQWGSQIVSFLKTMPGLRQELPDKAENRCKPWPSLRSWTNLGKCLAGASSVDASIKTRNGLILGNVGEATGKQFIKYLELNELPNPEDILRDPSQINNIKRSDLVTTIMGTIMKNVQDDNTPDRWEALKDIVEVIHKKNEEQATSMYSVIESLKPSNYTARVRTGAWREMAQTLADSVTTGGDK